MQHENFVIVKFLSKNKKKLKRKRDNDNLTKEVKYYETIDGKFLANIYETANIFMNYFDKKFIFLPTLFGYCCVVNSTRY